MDLDIPDPFLIVYEHPRMAVIRSCVTIMLPHGKDLHLPSVGCPLRHTRP